VLNSILNDISSEIDQKVENVNFGGCAVYALELAKRLRDRGFEPVIKLYASPEYHEIDVSEIEALYFATRKPKSCINSWWKYGVQFDHVVVQWRGRLWDSEGSAALIDGDGWDASNPYEWDAYWLLQKGCISIEALEATIKVPSNWNRRFDRRKIRKIRTIMDRHFALYDASRKQEKVAA
jgi:hypothetical protein